LRNSSRWEVWAEVQGQSDSKNKKKGEEKKEDSWKN